MNTRKMGERVRDVASDRSCGVEEEGRRPALLDDAATMVGRREPTGDGLDLDDALELMGDDAKWRRGLGRLSSSSSDVEPPDVWNSVRRHAEAYSLNDRGSTGGGGTVFLPPNTDVRRLIGVVSADKLESVEGRRRAIDSTLLWLGSLA